MIKRRSLLFQFIVYILTFGLYSFYWYYSTLDEMSRFNGKRTEPLLWTILMFIPLLNFFAMWRHAGESSTISAGNYPAILLWVLWIFVTPAVWILVQLELNRIAGTPFPNEGSAE